MIESKAEYFKVSSDLGLPGRCPIFDRCERKAHSIAVGNDTDRDDECRDLTKPVVPLSGDGPYQIGGENNFIVGGICPEVPLFESNNFIIGLNNMPTTKGQYDKYMTPKYQVLETGHFSECAEFSKEMAKPTVSMGKQNEKTWLAKNYQWVIATIISLVGLYLAYLTLK